ncbi:MAG: hypothetical protein ACJA01_000402 [Saprospiraceae bacterium]|jgi:hypothetical protein
MKPSRVYFSILILLLLFVSTYAQSEDVGRKGDILVESGSSIFAFENRGGTGVGLLSIDGFHLEVYILI